MARTLILMRHAEAAPDESADFARPLTWKGRGQAEDVGRILAERGLQPALRMVSPAARTMETADIIDQASQQAVRQVSPMLYNASVGRLRTILGGAHRNIPSIMMIGHNPGISQLALYMADRPEALESFSPASLAVLESEATDWSEDEPGRWRLMDFIPQD